MSMAETVAVLGRMPLFRSMGDAQLGVIAMSGDVLTFRAGERLAEKGETGEAAFILLKGEVNILVPSDHGETVVARLGPAELVGEMAVLTGNPRSAAIAAHTDLTVLRLSQDAVLTLLREFPELSIEIIGILARRIEATNALLP